MLILCGLYIAGGLLVLWAFCRIAARSDPYR